MAADAASLRTSIVSISPGFKKSIPPPITTPSTTNSGSDPLIEEVPRMRITAPDPGAPELCITDTPEVRPCSAVSMRGSCNPSKSSAFTLEIAPVTFDFF